ncbi:protein stoned-B-like [Anoplophora glabripennis]|uniref:protein stoned-B-like n=1 Tax=Anoplophora glabripennis TaxID=217634 RepID=UPI000C768900|nr:protein stoned-B-like [Anoplophora glabripennis]
MHKITKGLKKKKKGKKSKHKEEELFKPEELEEYRKEHQAATSADSSEKNEEWKKFIALTSEVDDILKKTQGDLDRIKSTSFFQRKPTESEVQRKAEKQKQVEAENQQIKKEEVNQKETPANLGIVEVSESESEEDDDNIFDTAYIDAIAAGEVKLAYIPESPTDKLDGDDPFDTSIAERAILGPEVQRKGKKLVPIGAAVEVLTGRVQLPTCATKRPISRRQILKQTDLLLGSFEDNSNLPTDIAPSEEAPRTLLDDDSIPLSKEPINLNAPLPVHIPNVASNVNFQGKVDQSRNIIDEFDVIAKESEDPDDIEFETLAAESLSKSAKVLESLPTNSSGPIDGIEWNAFGDNEKVAVEVDPFDTSFAENILPGRVELKIIEKEILNEDIEFKFQEDSTDFFNGQILDSSKHTNLIKGQRVPEAELNLIKPIHRDLLGGSNTDLSIINQPIESKINQGFCVTDLFDSSIVDTVKDADIIGLDQEIANNGLSDDDFDPRADEKPRERTVSRPDVLNISSAKTVSFDLTPPKQSNLLGAGEGGKIIKPLTPFYVRKNSVPEVPVEEDLTDPFDTSFASNIAPGRAELRVIETELFDPNVEKQLSLVDNDFDPRDEKKAERDKVVGIIKDITNIKLPSKKVERAVDLLAIDDNISVKVLTPGGNIRLEELSYCDPFDTSTIATNILPGKTELKLLETELINRETNLNLDKPVEDLLEDHHDIINQQPLSPGGCFGLSTIDDQEDFDPFDTSIANNIQPDTFASSSNTTNPFAFEPFESVSQQGNEFNAVSSNTYVNSNNEQDFFTTDEVLIPSKSSTSTFNVLVNSDQVAPPQKPVDLNLKCSQTTIGNGPPRPPPPRVPPSKETQDLLMSVMGAMDATSSSLLDKIPPTRTPSPVSMRDLHSPSPTPDTTFGDLLDNPAVIPTVQQVKPARPSPPVRPPKPAPPQKPPPPELPGILSNTQMQAQQQQPKPSGNKASELDEIPNMFDVETTQPQKVSVSKADILNLYNTAPPKPETMKTDLLFDMVEPELAIQDEPQENIQEKSEETPLKEDLITEISPVNPVSEVVKDSFLSPEPNDFQMDTSDSQSKGSVSSVTFNPFAATDDFNQQISPQSHNEVFEDNTSTNLSHTGGILDEIVTSAPQTEDILVISDSTTMPFNDDFDAFAEKFDSVKIEENKTISSQINNAWGNESSNNNEVSLGFGTDDNFDAFLALEEPPCVPQSTPNRISKAASQESDEDKDFSVFIRPKGNEEFGGALPTIAPPPAPVSTAFTDTSPRFNPFDQQNDTSVTDAVEDQIPVGEIKRTDSQETPPTPLFDDDVSQPLEPFPRVDFAEEGWEMHLRQPNKKKITGQRFWKKIFVKLVHQTDCVLLQLFNQKDDKDPFQELPLQPCYSVSEIGAQQYDQFGKIFTIKLQYIFYKERPGVRPGQVKKAERITNKISQFAAYAIQGDYQGVKEFGSDLKKLGLPVEHAPQVSQLMKLGSLNYEDLKQFSCSIEEALFKLTAHRDRALHYKMEEVQITAVDELYVEQDAEGHVDKQIARVRLFFLGFLTGMPDVELGINDMRRQGKEVVGRHDIIPVVTEEWIRLEEVEFHSCVQQVEYNETHIIKFKPPDACYIELLRFRVRPPKNRELPLQLKAQICVTGYKVELRADVLVPGFASRKLGQIPCEDVMIRFPIPECWIYMFRVEKHFRYGSVKSAHRRTGKIKGIERILGTVDTLQENLIEVTSGQAKYEHQHRAIVWRCPRLPKEGQGAYTTHNMVCRIALTNYDQMPEKLAEYCYVEFTMPATQVSHTTCRSVSLQNSDSDEPPEKYVRYLARHEYRVGIEHTEGESPNPYAAATFISKPPEPVAEEKPIAEESSSDSD